MNKMISDREFMDEARSNQAIFIRELEARISLLPSWSALQAQIARQEIRNRTCPECGFKAKDIWHLDYRHRGSKKCLLNQAERDGTSFVPESEQLVICECGYELQCRNLSKHKNGDLHKNRLAKANNRFFCRVCDKDFNHVKRPKKAYTQHCAGKRHLLRVKNQKEDDHTCDQSVDCGDHSVGLSPESEETPTTSCRNGVVTLVC